MGYSRSYLEFYVIYDVFYIKKKKREKEKKGLSYYISKFRRKFKLV